MVEQVSQINAVEASDTVELQADAVIAKTTRTIVGGQIDCGAYNRLTLFLEYTNGDETGVLIDWFYLYATGGTEFQDMTWSAAPGAKTFTVNDITRTVTSDMMIVLDVSGITAVTLYQGGSANDGTPTGKLAVNYTLTED